ncbi:carbohydrate ABC transporter permease [Dictyobacter kobayashii]|uniref:Thiamine ABC transporter ATP-binding protein n=1 Tax=Dictyobacter kobayashii TaxID=2014872 RepID=A0A402ADF6_9CHLR|nr:carbohydrate ABC transporter permease [Dictyobacter kobayashii]GCE17121.1 thiamine ABC transporter ATP-binding protein [Dictyobacter kobayashii]
MNNYLSKSTATRDDQAVDVPVAISQRSKRYVRPDSMQKHRLSVLTVGSYAIILLATVLYLFPLAYLVNISFKTLSDYFQNPTGVTKTVAWVNYVNAWNEGNFGAYFFNTVFYTIVATGVSVLFSLFIAFPIARGYVKASRFWYTLFVISLFLPSALIPQFQLILHLGLYDTQIGYILVASNLGLGPFLIAGYLKSIPKELDEAATIDGCGYVRYVLTIIIPLSRPILVTALLLHAIDVWNDIIGPTIYLSNPSYSPISLGLFSFFGLYTNDWVTLAAATVIVAAPLIVLFIFLQRYFISGALSGALKA